MTNPPPEWVFRRGQAARGIAETVIDSATPGWQHTGLFVLELGPGGDFSLAADDSESIVLPLTGGCHVQAGEHSATLTGRASVFAGPTDCAYLPAGLPLTVTADRPARIAIGRARTHRGSNPDFRYIAAADVPVENRGAGVCARQVRNFGTTDTLNADALIACEVITPAGKFSSYPPHKHDTERDGMETDLEEIYYFETQSLPDAPADADPVGYLRVYASDERPIDVLAEVRTGDVVLVPYGWHGPAIASPTADLYYFNVMAGPGPERAWLIADDPSHGWVRARWESGQAPAVGTASDEDSS